MQAATLQHTGLVLTGHSALHRSHPCACGVCLKSHSILQGTQEPSAPLLLHVVRPIAFSGLETLCRTPHHVHCPKSGRKLNKTTQQPFCLHAFTAGWLKEPRLFAPTFFTTYCVMKTHDIIGTHREMWQTLYIYLGSEITWTLDSLSLSVSKNMIFFYLNSHLWGISVCMLWLVPTTRAGTFSHAVGNN